MTSVEGYRLVWYHSVRKAERDVLSRHHRIERTSGRLAELRRQRERAEALGAKVLLDRTDDPDEPLYVFADLSGHPFCIFVR